MFGAPPKGGLAAIQFAKYDTDKSGSIDVQEFQNLCYNLDHALTSEEVKVCVMHLDADGSGKLEKDEFIKWWKLGSRRWSDIDLDAKEMKIRMSAASVFKSCDTDGSGSITPSEFDKLYQGLKEKKLTTATKEEAFKALDVDQSKSIQFNEYVRWLKKTGTISIKMISGAEKVKLKKVTAAQDAQPKAVESKKSSTQEIRHKHLNKFGKKRAALEDEIDGKNRE
eukprot:CAMPEP_0170177224 /NCGR_PEP_ID=MMETSP0040_2-20121228/9923_1 /TAXON_ID=641309 /ORGANISM="Lotharella oceanica, Strain CCMP622" /LENGTH=223 /DNA_ID=CAMNT_0010419797 /DNA_START=1 /DNA_END=672 /DNA_ORIENTATION=+